MKREAAPEQEVISVSASKGKKKKYDYRLNGETEDLNELEQALLNNFKRNQGHSLRTLVGIYKGHYAALFLSVLFFAVKHSPVWILPIVTSNIINIATDPGENAARDIILNVVFMTVMIAQNILSNYFHTLFYSRAIRNVEKDLRGALVRKLQQLSITYHNEMQSGRLQSKIMRDVEQVETVAYGLRTSESLMECRRKLVEEMDNMFRETVKLTSLSSALQQVAALYRYTEMQNANGIDAIEPSQHTNVWLAPVPVDPNISLALKSQAPE